MRKFLSLFLLTAALAISASAQPRFAGKVGEVIDGRTLLVETNAGKMRVQLQYIEVPEPDQAFASVVKQHLSKLTVGNTVEFRPVRLGDDHTIGLVMLGDVDLSLQMIRDGAAWHEPAKTSGQAAASAAEYASNQEKAKAERRGVWSAKDLKTPDQVRFEREDALARADAERRSKRPSMVGLGEFQSDNRGMAEGGGAWTGGNGKSDLDSWGDLFAGVGKETYGLHTYKDPQGRFESIYTSVAFVNMKGAKIERRLEFRGIFAIVNMPDGRRRTSYMIGFRTVAPEYYFSKRRSHLAFTVDKKNLAVGAALGGRRGESSVGAVEIVYYLVSKATVKSVASGNDVEISIDGLRGTVPQEIRNLFKQLVDTMN